VTYSAVCSTSTGELHERIYAPYGRVNAELVYGHGVIVNRKTVRKIMRIEGLHGLPGARKTFRSRVNMATAADLVQRQFDRSATDQLWVTDVTEHPTREGKVYCCVVLDVFSCRVVGWSIDSHQATRWSPTPWAWPSTTATRDRIRPSSIAITARRANSTGRRNTLTARSCDGSKQASGS
jgi:transposase InsO family protein